MDKFGRLCKKVKKLRFIPPPRDTANLIFVSAMSLIKCQCARCYQVEFPLKMKAQGTGYMFIYVDLLDVEMNVCLTSCN